VSFDLVVWAADADVTPDGVRAANELCRRGEHAGGPTDLRIATFHAALTAHYPDREPAAHRAGSPWASVPLHVGTDHLRMCLDVDCADAVLETIERLAGEHDLMLLDLQDGSVYPPPQRVA
jgi:hypothetical protein